MLELKQSIKRHGQSVFYGYRTTTHASHTRRYTYAGIFFPAHRTRNVHSRTCVPYPREVRRLYQIKRCRASRRVGASREELAFLMPTRVHLEEKTQHRSRSPMVFTHAPRTPVICSFCISYYPFFLESASCCQGVDSTSLPLPALQTVTKGWNRNLCIPSTLIGCSVVASSLFQRRERDPTKISPVNLHSSPPSSAPTGYQWTKDATEGRQKRYEIVIGSASPYPTYTNYKLKKSDNCRCYKSNTVA